MTQVHELREGVEISFEAFHVDFIERGEGLRFSVGPIKSPIQDGNLGNQFLEVVGLAPKKHSVKCQALKRGFGVLRDKALRPLKPFWVV